MTLTREIDADGWSDNRAWTAEADLRPDGFWKVINPVSALVDECQMDIRENAVHVRAVDPAQVAVVDVERQCVRQTDATLSAGVLVNGLGEDLPGYFDTDTYTLTVSHGSGDDTATVASPHGRAETAAYDPETVRDAPDWPTPDDGWDRSVTLPAPKARGVLGGIADAAESGVRVSAEDGELLVEAVDRHGTVDYSWPVAADVEAGPYAFYSADYLSDMVGAFWPDGEITIRFGHEQPLELQNGTLRYTQAQRMYSEFEGGDDR
ncbi:hypothetical protein [Haloarcula sp. JP-L23]|uniref:hypothetical protein n=1 Tax=Haloarcula sp. JP-L23 TaxID=2716717 RepID=UPI00140F32C8|nr:hypothetical protein G9465_24775 [Haloarcula sp. JP-L23]